MLSTDSTTAPAQQTDAVNLEAAQVTAAPETTPTDGAATDDKTSPVEKTFTQAQLDEIVQKRLAKAESKAERRATQAYKDALEAVTRNQPVQRSESAEPTRDQFASDADWIDAKVDYKLQKREAESRAGDYQRQQQSVQAKTETLYKQAAKIDGFDRDDFDALPLTKTIAETLSESDVAPQLMAYMASNPAEVERIASLSPARQSAELGKLEVKLQTTKTTKAPAPITPVGSQGAVSPPLDQLSFAEYKAKRAKDGALWAR